MAKIIVILTLLALYGFTGSDLAKIQKQSYEDGYKDGFNAGVKSTGKVPGMKPKIKI